MWSSAGAYVSSTDCGLSARSSRNDAMASSVAAAASSNDVTGSCRVASKPSNHTLP